LPFALRFLLATDPKALTRVLGIVYRTISAHVLRKARLTRVTDATGPVMLIQRFGSALNLNIHFHVLVLDGAYRSDTGEPVFRRIAAPRAAELQPLVERLARYLSRPTVAIEHLALTAQGQVRYRLKTPYRDGTTHIVLEPVDFIARLAALVPPPRKHLTHFHGVFAIDIEQCARCGGSGERRMRRLRRSARGRRRRAGRESCPEPGCRRRARYGR
jgi:hypothetical protein